MVKRLNNCIPAAAMLLLHMLLYSGMASFTLRRDQVNRLGTAMLPFILAIVLAAWLFPWALRWFREARAGVASRAGRWRLLPALAALVAFPLSLMAGYGAWLENIPLRHFSNAAMAILVPAAYTIFYSRMTPRRRGLWLGMGVAAGFILWRTLVVAAGWWNGGADVAGRSGLYAVYMVQTALAFALAAILLYGLFRIQPASPAPPMPEVLSLAARRRAIWLLFGAAGLVYVMNAFIDIRMFPVLLDRTSSPFEPLQLLAALSCPLVGWLVDRNPRDGFRRIALGCACVFILAPSLAALGETPWLYRVVHAATAAGQFAILVAFSTILAGLSPPGDAVGKYATLLFAWRGISVLGFLLVRVTLALPTGAAALLATVMAAAYYLLIRQVGYGEPRGMAVFDTTGSAHEQTDDQPAPGANTDAASSGPTTFRPEALDPIFASHGLTPREREVAELLLRGAGTREIAEALSISDNTVKAHVKKIFNKFEITSRFALLNKVMVEKTEHGR